jgi:hypothetical protein
MLEFDEDTDLSHNFVSIAGIRSLCVETTGAGGVTFFSLLFPDVEINSVCWVVGLPLRSTVFRLFTLWEIPNVKILIELISLSHWCPRQT